LKNCNTEKELEESLNLFLDEYEEQLNHSYRNIIQLSLMKKEKELNEKNS